VKGSGDNPEKEIHLHYSRRKAKLKMVDKNKLEALAVKVMPSMEHIVKTTTEMSFDKGIIIAIAADGTARIDVIGSGADDPYAIRTASGEYKIKEVCTHNVRIGGGL